MGPLSLVRGAWSVGYRRTSITLQGVPGAVRDNVA
jgi:hypothetical protein